MESALGDEHARGLRRGGVVGLGHRALREPLEQGLELTVAVEGVEVADHERGSGLRRPAAGAKGDDAVARERVAQVLGGAQHRPAERMVTEHGLVDEVLGDRRRLVVVARDLLHDDAPLAVELLAVEVRSGHEVGEQVGRFGAALGPRGDVEGDEVVARVGVEHRTDPLGPFVDVAIVRVLLAALEHEVLQEVRHPVLLGALGPGSGVERGQDGDRTGSLDRDPMQPHPVGEGFHRDLRHVGRTVACAPDTARG